VQFLDAEFTGSDIPDQVGKTPAFAPDFLFKGGITFWKQGCFNVTLTGIYVAQQFWSDMIFHFQPFPQKFLPTKSSTFQVNTTSLGMCD
jgi:hypothetical protein